ncbi:MAG: acetolactate synthase small subunit [Clostridiaceae bacterium]|nr:acetolactate synthase small subunit [Clostridiaceae bacterium]
MRIISILVENNAGSLARISSLFSRRGYNIDSLTVSSTEDEHYSTITLTADLEELELQQLMAQTAKLQEVIKIQELHENSSVLRELLLIKLAVNSENRSQIMEVATVYNGVVVDLSSESLIIELTGKPGKIDAFIKVLSAFNIINYCRTGVTGMIRV